MSTQPYIYPHDGTFYFTTAGQIIPSISSIVSLVSSSIMVFLILKSGSGLSSSYHRIMFNLGFWDIVASTAVAFSSLPMPKDTIYPFAGMHMYGTVATCEVQAIIRIVGVVFSVISHIALNTYYVCAIRYNMSESTINNVVLPIIFISLGLLGLPPVIVSFQNDNINPQPYDFGCSFAPYPIECTDTVNYDVECIRGKASTTTEFGLILYLITLVFSGITLIITMILVILTSYKLEMEAHLQNKIREQKSLQVIRNTSANSDQFIMDNVEEIAIASSTNSQPQLMNTIMLLRQGGMYIGAFILTYLFVIISFLVEDNWTIQILKCIFFPLQGLFNFMIFSYQKVHNVQRAHKEFSKFQAFKTLFSAPSEVPELFLTKMSMVKNWERNPSPTEDNGTNLKSGQPGSFQHSSIGLSLDTPSVDLSNALSSNGISYGSGKDNAYYENRINTYSHYERNSVEIALKTHSQESGGGPLPAEDDISLEIIYEEEESIKASR